MGEAVTPDVWVPLCIGSAILGHSTSCTSRMLKATPSPLVWVTSSLLARATSLTSACQRVTESSCPLLRSVTSVWQGLEILYVSQTYLNKKKSYKSKKKKFSKKKKKKKKKKS